MSGVMDRRDAAYGYSATNVRQNVISFLRAVSRGRTAVRAEVRGVVCTWTIPTHQQRPRS